MPGLTKSVNREMKDAEKKRQKTYFLSQTVTFWDIWYQGIVSTSEQGGNREVALGQRLENT